jgi:hypothetical protein
MLTQPGKVVGYRIESIGVLPLGTSYEKHITNRVNCH